ncbi:hypothetical protein N9H56_05755 [Pseudomonadales bacterium]|nr:hypothetical protein [Pseudomonadales bacterium]
MPSLLSVLPSAPLKLIFALTDYKEDPATSRTKRDGLSLAMYSHCYTLNPATQATQPKQRNPSSATQISEMPLDL